MVSRRLTFDPPTQRARFPFAIAFPPEDAVGHFVLGLAAAMNDLNLLNSLLWPPEDVDRDDFTEPERGALIRMLLAVVWEAHLLVASASKLPAVSEFLDAVAHAYPSGKRFSGQELVGFLSGAAGATAPAVRNVLRAARNATFHYPRVTNKALSAALRDFDGAEGQLVRGEHMPSVRATFADEVLLHLALRGVEPPGEEGIAGLFSALGATVVAIIHLAQVATDLWLDQRGDVTVEAIDETPAP